MYGAPRSFDDGFRCQVKVDSDRAVLRPSGELDLATVELVEQPLHELRHAGWRALVLDLRALTFMDSSGLALLVRWDRIARRDRLAFEIVLGDDPRLRRPLELTGLLELLPVVDEPGALELPATIAVAETPVGELS